MINPQTVFSMVLSAMGLAAGGYFYFFRKDYPVDVLIAEKRGKGIRWTFDKAKRIRRKDGSQIYRLRKKKCNIAPPDFQYLNLGAKGKTVLPLYSPQEGQFAPMCIDVPPKLKVEDKEVTFWDVLETRRTYEIYPKKLGFFEKYAPYIILGFTGALMALITLFIGEKLSAMAGYINSAAVAFKQAAELIAQGRPAPPLT